MVESRLHRVPRDGTPETVHLFQINVEINLSKNPKISGMFADPQAAKEMDAFFRTHDIRIESKFGDGINVSRIELRGSPEGLVKFHDTYLTDDNSSVVYDLQYR